MSASLVGSEMCIRDSFMGTFLKPSSGITFCCTSRMTTFQELLRSALDVPVSYTHLTLPTICSV
eukprot:9497904-Alexandrium_andersonii.AAC.1